MAPFYGWGSTASRLEPLQGGSLLFTTKFPESSQFLLFPNFASSTMQYCKQSFSKHMTASAKNICVSFLCSPLLNDYTYYYMFLITNLCSLPLLICVFDFSYTLITIFTKNKSLWFIHSSSTFLLLLIDFFMICCHCLGIMFFCSVLLCSISRLFIISSPPSINNSASILLDLLLSFCSLLILLFWLC